MIALLEYPECYECAYGSPHTHRDGTPHPQNTTDREETSQEQETDQMNIHDMLDAQKAARDAAIDRFTILQDNHTEDTDSGDTDGDDSE